MPVTIESPAQDAHFARGVRAVIVCFRSEILNLTALVQALLPVCESVILVHNGSEQDWPDALLHLSQFDTCELIHCGANLGIAAALNRGIDKALEQGAGAVVLFDQDSLPSARLVHRLQQVWLQSENQGIRVGAVGPVLVDRGDSQVLWAYLPSNWGRRRFLPRPPGTWQVDHLITSGCLIPASAIARIGTMNEALFIDGVDLEWSARARAQGFVLLMDGQECLLHRIGETRRMVLGRRMNIHKPFRSYFIVRNACIMLRDPRLQLGWRLTHALQVLRGTLVSTCAGNQKLARLHFVLWGLWHGLLGRSGALPNGTIEGAITVSPVQSVSP